jgi:hemerythrin-like metal-binding protein
VQQQAPRPELYRLMEEVIAYTVLHFAAEERLMADFSYPETAAHKAKHRQLVEDARHFRAKLDNVGEGAFAEWFHHWPFTAILAHIQYADQQLGEHVVKAARE